jgi:hypothetical protein
MKLRRRIGVMPAALLAPPLDVLELLRLMPEQFAAVCLANPHALRELDAIGQIIHMTPTGGDTGARNGDRGDLPGAPAAPLIKGPVD